MALLYVFTAVLWMFLWYFGLGWIDYWWHIPQHWNVERQPHFARTMAFAPPVFLVLTTTLIFCGTASRFGRVTIGLLSLIPLLTAGVAIQFERFLRFAGDDAYTWGITVFGTLVLLTLASPFIALASVRYRRAELQKQSVAFWVLVWLSGPLVLLMHLWLEG